MATPTLSLLLRSTAPRRSLPLALSSASASRSALISPHPLLLPSRRHASAASPPPSSTPTPPPSVQANARAAPVQVGGEDQVLPGGGANENAKLYSDPDTLSYRQLMNIFSKTITDAFATPAPRAVDRQTLFRNTAEYERSLKRPGLAVMEDPGTFHMVERIRDAGVAEGMELEAVNQHILEVLDSIAPPPTEVTYSLAERQAEAEDELKVALQMLKDIKAENLERYHGSTIHKVYSYLPAALSTRLDARKVKERNGYDARISRLMTRIMDCGFEAQRDPQEMSLLLKRGYFPPHNPDAIPAETEQERLEKDQGEVKREYVKTLGHPGANFLCKDKY